MKIVFTGGGTGGHFYPIIAVAEKVNQIVDTQNILSPKLFYISDSPYDQEVLFENGILYEEVYAGKMRVNPNMKGKILNFLDTFKVFMGTLNAIYKMFTIYPDVVFGKGGYASFPTLFAARLLGVPVVIHESDSVPGRVNKWASKFATKIAVSFEEAGNFFPAEKVAWIGQPIRSAIEAPSTRADALEYFKFESNVPVLFVIGGSQGAELINNTIIDALPRLIKTYQIVHQTGVKNYKTVKGRSDVILADNPNRARYISIPFLNPLAMKMAAGAATVVVSRAGSTLFEIASWGLPSILVPFAESNGDHSKVNAFAYARAGACSVIEEMNMKSNILSSEIDRIVNDKNIYQDMVANAKAFGKKDAAMKIAQELIDIALSHEK